MSYTAKEAMKLIQILDPEAHIDYSIYSDKWYVSAKISIGDTNFLSSISEHRHSPEQAVFAYLVRLQDIKKDEYLVTQAHQFDEFEEIAKPARQEWRWQNDKWELTNVVNQIKRANLLYDLKRAQEREQDDKNEIERIRKKMETI